MRTTSGLILFALLTSLPAFSQKQLTLSECQKLALKNSIAVQKAQNLAKTSLIDINSSRFNLLPAVSFNMEHYLSYGKNIDPVTNIFVNENFSGGSMGIGLDLKVFSGFSSLYAIKQSRYANQAAGFSKQQTELTVQSNTTVIFARLLLTSARSSAIRNNILTTNKEIEITNEKIKVGKVSKSEYYFLNARVQSEMADLIASQNDSLAALQDLKQILNIDYNEEITVAPLDNTVVSGMLSALISSKEIIDMVLQRHPAIQLARMNENVARLGQKITKSSLSPYLSVGGNLGSNYNVKQTNGNGAIIKLPNQINNNFGENIYISLRMPVFSRMQLTNRIKKERLLFSNLQLATSEAENIVISNTLQLVNDFNAAKKIFIATQSAWEQNILSYSVFEEKYRLGLVSTLELITAKDILNASNSKYLQSSVELYFRYQLLELLQTEL